MNIRDWLHTIGSGLEEWFENHIGLPIILIIFALVALFHPKFVYNFFFPRDHQKKEVSNETD